MPKTILVAEMNYGPEQVENLREEMIRLRDSAMSRGDMGWAVTLSHVVAYMAVSKGIIFEEEKQMTTNIAVYQSDNLIVPLAEVQHCEVRRERDNTVYGLVVVMKSTRWDNDNDIWENVVWIDKDQVKDFSLAFNRYLQWKHVNAKT